MNILCSYLLHYDVTRMKYSVPNYIGFLKCCRRQKSFVHVKPRNAYYGIRIILHSVRILLTK